jgi:very-short-patch-repair endonuclease
LVTFGQLIEAGVPASTVANWVTVHRLERRYPEVYAVAGSARSKEQELLAAVLAAGPGAVASHRAAAWLWGLRELFVVEITIPVDRCVLLPGVVVHRSTDLDRTGTTVRRRVPVTDPMRTLVDLGAVAPARVVNDALEQGVSDRLMSIPGIERSLHLVARRGRRGAGVLRRILDDRALGDDVPDGVLEPRMARLLLEHGLPPAVFQHSVRVGGRRFRIDFAFPAVKLGIEVKGWKWHGSPEAMDAGFDREVMLIADGWIIISFSWRAVVRRPRQVAAQIRAVLCRLEPGFGLEPSKNE